METLNYIGSKKTLFNTILDICRQNVTNIEQRSFADLFAGTGTVGFNMSQYFKMIESNDLEYYSYVINRALLTCCYSPKLEILINNLNQLEVIEGLIYQHFSPSETSQRLFFTNHNAKKADAIRQHIELLLKNNQITENEYMFLVASLLVSIDKVANTSSVYGAYLKEFKKTAENQLKLKPIHTKTNVSPNNQVYNLDVETLVENRQFDIVYLDPPYNHRQYSSNYSPLNYIAQYDATVNLKGKTGLIDDYNKSNFCSKVKVKSSFENLINKLKCNCIILSYNNEGLLKKEDIKKILINKGNVKLYKISYNKFKSQQGVKIDKVEEYLWVVDVYPNSTSNHNFTEITYELVR